VEPRYHTLSIERFRAIQSLKLEGMGRVNLITGKNNTGKSSVLEALRILCSEASPYVLADILQIRDEDFTESKENGGTLDKEKLFEMSSLFCGFPKFDPGLPPIELALEGSGEVSRMEIAVDWISSALSVLPDDTLFSALKRPGLIIRLDGQSRLLDLADWRTFYGPKEVFGWISQETIMPTVFVSPNVGERTSALGELWDQIALRTEEELLIESLRIIDPGITKIAMVGKSGRNQTRIVLVKSNTFDEPIPLRSFGDGMNRIFAIMLSLANARDGLLLIDEIENGLHHTVQADLWRMIFKLAAELNVQVVATSHSWDAIEAFQTAAFRLTRREDEIIPTRFVEDELAVVTSNGIEVR
jgi:ABC-type cobalamin/Fe3+-siderophores transport system ATPase subunit